MSGRYLSHEAEASRLARALVAGASDAIMALDRNGRITVWNRGCEQMYGWSADEVLGQAVDVLLPEQRRDELHRVLRGLDGVPEAAAVETERLHKSGAIVQVSCRITPIWDESGEVLGVSAVVRDNSREMELRRQLEVSRHLAEARFAQSVVAQASLTPEGVVEEVNAALCRLSGYREQDLLGRLVTDFVAEWDVELTAVGLALLAVGDVPGGQHPRLLRHADGHLIETRVSIFPVLDETGKVLRLETVVEDVSAAAAAERELRLREARWQSLALNSADVAMLCDADGALHYVSTAITSVFGYTVEQLEEVDAWSFVHPDDVESARAVWRATAAEVGAKAGLELRLLHADGSWRWTEARASNSLGDPAIKAMVVNLLDVTERKAAEAVLDELAGTDSLTGLATRAPLMAALDAAFAANLAATTAVAVIDISDMKLINDTHGHQVGDEVLSQVAARLHAAMPPLGVVARIGGDRFAALLHADDVGELFEISAALLEVVQRPLALARATLPLRAAVGAALGPAVESGALLASAETALGTAKEGLTGPMHVVRAESASAALCRARLVDDLRRGLAQDEMVVHFQPVMSLSEGQPVAAEALVRWMHPEKGLLGPGAFIDAAEDSGLIVDIGRKVLHEACNAAAAWGSLGHRDRPFHVAVNLSAKQLVRGDIFPVVRDALRSSGAAPANLMLEVTESAVMADVDAAVKTLQQLRHLGVAIAVDDFGTGYSSLTYLKRFPVTALKIDRSFVSGLGVSGDDAAIVTSVINLARAMRLDCIAEGVETEQQRLVLQALGCSLGQGFLWAPALDVETFRTWVGDATSLPRPDVQPYPSPGDAPVDQAAARPAPDATVLARIDKLSDSGASFATIAAALNADRLLTPEGRRWTARSVAQRLASRQAV